MNWYNRYADPAYWPLRLIVGLMFAWPRGTIAYPRGYKDFGKDRLNIVRRATRMVDIKSGDSTIKAFVVYPERKTKRQSMLVIQEILV